MANHRPVVNNKTGVGYTELPADDPLIVENLIPGPTASYIGVEKQLRVEPTAGVGSKEVLLDGDTGLAKAETFQSVVATGTAPMVVASTTLVTNFNADKLDGLDSTAFATASHTHTASQITDFAEAVDDRVAVLLIGGTGITVTYNDGANTLTIIGDASDFVTAASGNLTSTTLNAALAELQTDIDTRATSSALTTHTSNVSNPHSVTKAQVGLSNVQNVDATARANHTGSQLASTISDFAEAVDDRVFALFVQGSGTTLTYNDGANTFTVAVNAATIVTAASGNLTATTLNAALAELQSDIDSRAVAKGSVTIIERRTPGSSAATVGSRAGGSVIPESFPIVSFNDTTNSAMDWLCVLQGYSGGGLNITVAWMAASATSGTVVWSVGIRRLTDDADDLDNAEVYAALIPSGATTSSAAGEVKYTTIFMSHASYLDGWSSGELALIRIRRLPADAGDTMVGDAQIITIIGKEP